MYYLHRNFSDALYFLTAQPAFGAQRSSDQFILIYQVIFRYVKMFLTVTPNSLLFFRVNQEFWISIVFLILGIIAFRKIRTSYAIFSMLAFITPTLTGTFSSMPRYVLISFPVFMLLGMIKNQFVVKILYTIFVILLGINTMLFTRGYWVA
jgi:hypothetical protein